ncbi:tumor necrosis factor receptor superfamily member 21 precursor [Silurus asotus]|uniref:Tumor necrosis factor receptor superfamily member 21 n=1 Tax=Silurus asotus TaxID=30991 RepID=A0AAD5ALD4_SILAS|nr:tumor necrosis factor receptor superfamily member 21 precursor [Silurus asotus]
MRMSACDTPPRAAMRLRMFFVVSFAWAYHETPRYQQRDPVTSELLLCDQCPPGTAVERHCTSNSATVCHPCPERRFAEQWHWGESCQHCTPVCKERQIVKRECNATHNRLCECVPGYHLSVEFCVPHSTCPPGFGVSIPGTPDSDTVCEKCPQGFFSSMVSATEPCVLHRDCSQLGMKTRNPGTATQDTVCDRELAIDCTRKHTVCHADITLCEKAMFQFLLSPPLASLDLLLESLPGRKVDKKIVEPLKKKCSPEQQALHLLRLWIEQNKDQGKFYSIIQGLNHCERKVSRCAGLKNVTLGDLLVLMDSLPGEKVSEEEVQALALSCPMHRHVAQLLHLWKSQNASGDLAKALNHSVRQLRSRNAPKTLLRAIKRISRVINASTHRPYEKILTGAHQDASCFKLKPYND